MLRVLVLSTLFPSARRPNFGIFVERQTLELAARAGVEVQVVAPVGVPPPPLSSLVRYRAALDLPRCERWKGLRVHRPVFRTLPLTAGRFHAAGLERALLPLLSAIRREFDFDVIAAEFFFPDGVAATAIGRRLGVPVSIKARGSDIHHWARQRTTQAQILRAAHAADGLLAVSDALGRDMIALGMPGARIRTSLTGVDQERFGGIDRADAKRHHNVDGPLVVSVGALIPLKGHDLVIRAVAELPGVRLWIAGEGAERSRLASLADKLGVADRICLLGSVPHDALPSILAAADVMALASEREGLANAWLEALASGTPIVIPDVGGARQVVREPAAGRLVERSPGAIARALRELLAFPPDPEAVRAAAAPFTWQANAAALHAHLAALVAGPSSAAAA